MPPKPPNSPHPDPGHPGAVSQRRRPQDRRAVREAGHRDPRRPALPLSAQILDFTKPYSIAEAPTDTECVVKAEVFASPAGASCRAGGGWSGSRRGMFPALRSHGSIIPTPPRSWNWGRNTIFRAS